MGNKASRKSQEDIEKFNNIKSSVIYDKKKNLDNLRQEIIVNQADKYNKNNNNNNNLITKLKIQIKIL